MGDRLYLPHTAVPIMFWKPHVRLEPGVFFFHPDSVTDTYDHYHEKLATYLQIDNSMFEYDYIMANDSEQALNKYKEKYFTRCLHLLCWLHLHENLTNNCRYKKKKDKKNWNKSYTSLWRPWQKLKVLKSLTIWKSNLTMNGLKPS